MDAVTYPDPGVQQDLAEHFTTLKIDMLAKHPDFKAASLNQRVIWAPTFVFSDARHREIRRFVGWLPPEGFRAELKFVGAMARFNGGDFEGARSGFQSVLDAYPSAQLRPEALYWTGIAGFLAGRKDWSALREAWGTLAAEHPESRFGTHASVIEDAPG